MQLHTTPKLLAALGGLLIYVAQADAQTQTSLNNAGYWITSNYIAVLGRLPDSAGWIYWLGALTGVNLPPGQSLGTYPDVTTSFLTGSEYCGDLGSCSPSDLAFLTSLYQNAYQRAPDALGEGFWMCQMEPSSSYCSTYGFTPPSTALTHAQVVTGFIQSAEFTSKHGLGSPSPNAANYCSGYTNSIGYSSPPTVSAGVEQVLTFTYPNYCGVNDISGGHVWVKGGPGGATQCYVGWDNFHNITLV
jgi:Domain of unknown function (DUF4214)